MPVVAMPDGAQVSFPDEMPPDQIKGLILQKFPDAGKKVGAGEAFGKGLANTATFNFADELAGLGAVGAEGTNQQSLNPLESHPISNIVRGAYRKFTAEPSLSGLITGNGVQKTYDQAREGARQEIKQAETDQPVASLAGNVTGALTTPVGGALRAATWGGRALRGAAFGAGTGAISGIGEGEGAADRAAKGATGFALGGAIGGVGTPLVEGAVRGAGLLVSKPAGMISAALNPTGAAERAIGRAGQEAQRADPAAANRLTAADLGGGGPATVLDTLGQPGRNLARSAGNISGEARDVLSQTLDPRFEEQVPRLTNWLRATFHYPDAHAQQQAIERTAKAVNSPAYAKAKQDGLGGVMDQELYELSQAPVMQDAIKAAIKEAQNRSAPDVSQGAAALTARWMSPQGKPTIEMWDLVKRRLDQEINVATREGRSADIGVLTDIKSTLVGKLDAAVPSYAQARQGAAHFFGAENALEAGQKFVTENFAIPQTRQVLAQMSSSERQLFQDGFVSRFVETLQKIPDRADVVRRIFNAPEAKAKFEIALGPQRAKEFEAMLRVENIMQQGLRGVQGNSTTAMQLAGIGLAGATGGGLLGFDPTASGLASALAATGKRGIDQRVASRVAELLTSKDPAVVQRGAQAIAASPRLLGALRTLDSGVARIGGQQAPKNVLQATGAARADQDQPEVPRPVP